ncbi:MAG TPA: sigma-70 family RNA polymerase sigma factor [Pirellulaceae bacterium]|nr:sigma-70 family RNA polymerase sigma factor [Pirellulaceae bacterium]
MSSTSASLLDRLRDGPQSPAWLRMNDIYQPLIRSWLHRQDVLASDADDLVQEVLAVVVRRLPDFEHNQRVGAFRTWLKTITINVVRDHWRSKKNRPAATGSSQLHDFLHQLEDQDSGLSRLWDEEHDRHVTHRLLEMLKGDFEPKTWQAFTRMALDGLPAADVAQELGLTTNAVFIAKSRVLARLRQEAAGMVE